MEGLDALQGVESIRIVAPIFYMVVFAFVFISIISVIVGKERRLTWFKKRTNYRFFSRRGFIGEYINFGYPRTWQGLLLALFMIAVIGGLGYAYIVLYPYA